MRLGIETFTMAPHAKFDAINLCVLLQKVLVFAIKKNNLNTPDMALGTQITQLIEYAYLPQKF